MSERARASEFQMWDLLSDGRHTLRLSGEIDVLAAPRLEEAIRRLPRDGQTAVVIDLSRVSFMDSSGLRTLLLAQKLASSQGFELSLVPGPAHVQSLFQMTGLLELLPFQAAGEYARLPEDAILPKLFKPGDPGDEQDER